MITTSMYKKSQKKYRVTEENFYDNQGEKSEFKHIAVQDSKVQTLLVKISLLHNMTTRFEIHRDLTICLSIVSHHFPHSNALDPLHQTTYFLFDNSIRNIYKCNCEIGCLKYSLEVENCLFSTKLISSISKKYLNENYATEYVSLYNVHLAWQILLL